jgi:IMP cyclohydrolase
VAKRDKKVSEEREYDFNSFINSYLSTRRYPGRGIILGEDTLVYFIMGRSENSCNRVLRRTMDGIRTEAFDPAKLEDPSLVIYNAVRRVPRGFVVTNGSQTDDIVNSLLRYDGYSDDSGEFTDAVYGLSFEPDPPIYTPRISGFLDIAGTSELAIARHFKSADRIGCERRAWILGGTHFISTYDDDGNPPPSFSGNPISITDIPEDCVELAERVWGALDRENRVALYALTMRFDASYELICRDIIINKHEKISNI